MSGDGRVDLLTAASGAVFLSIQNEDGSFADPAMFQASGGGLVVADVDEDGHVDLVHGEAPDRLVIRLGDGFGGFGVVQASKLPRVPRGIAIRDFDGDGAPDVAVARGDRNAIQILEPTEPSAGSMEITSVPLSGCADNRGCRPHSGTVGDFDDDGDLDAVVSITHPGSFGILENDNGTLRFVRNYVFGGEHPQSAAAGDVDEDGVIDVVTCDNLDHNIYVHRSMGDLRFASPVRFPVGRGSINVQLGDLDGDGHLDAVTANQSSSDVSVLYGNGEGRFAPRGTRDYRAGGGTKAVALGDLDADGRMDIAAANSSVPSLTLLYQRMDGSFSTETLRISGAANHVALGEIDDDGHLDLAAAIPSDQACVVLRGDGGGGFEDPVDVPIGVAPYSVMILDVDADGLGDLVTGSEVASQVSIVLQVEPGQFGAAAHHDGGTGLRFPLPGDFDGDGDLDFVTPDREGHTATVFLQRGDDEEPDFLERICTPLDFATLDRQSTGVGSSPFLKFLAPVRDDAALLPLVFQNTDRYPLHEDFLVGAFPDRFPALTRDDYDVLVGRRATRDYYAGAVRRLRLDDPASLRGLDPALAARPLYGFSLFAQWDEGAEALTADEVRSVHERLSASFHLEPFVYAPSTPAARTVADEWDDPGFPVAFEDERGGRSTFVSYTSGVGYGVLQVLDPLGFETAVAIGLLSFRDIIVLEEAPRDIEGVVSGVITAQPQGELSHLAVRTARRGTPNAFVEGAPDRFEEFDGKLVRLEVTGDDYRVREAALDEAERWWEASRPELSRQPTADRDYDRLTPLDEILDQETAGDDVLARFGGKATNLARLRGVFEGQRADLQEIGFAIPVRHYFEFLSANRMPSALDEDRIVTYEEYVEELLTDDELRSDSRARFRALHDLRDHMEDESEVPAELVRAIATRIAVVFEDTDTRVRFRSSSNAEDALEFNGAGLYDSTSACAADDLDADGRGPSRCDADQDDERGVARALRRVWASLWNFRAFEEREFFGIDHRDVAMAILVSRAFVDELANGVAFTGDPSSSDSRLVVVVQDGDRSVVSPEPGEVAEKNVLEIDDDGEVTSILRVRSSSLLPEGRFVLTDDQLRELGSVLARIRDRLPVDLGPHAAEDVLIDVEFKIESGGTLAIKQARPFLRSGPVSEEFVFEIDVPSEVDLCGVFIAERSPRDELMLKSVLRLSAGTVPLRSELDAQPASLIAELRVGPDAELATPLADTGLVRRTRLVAGGGRTTFAFDYEEDFELPSGEAIRVTIAGIDFETVDGQPVAIGRRLSEDPGADGVAVRARFRNAPQEIAYGPCRTDDFPLFEIRFEFTGGESVDLEERFLEDLLETGPASLERARVAILGEGRDVADYWQLVYAASRHNERVRYWVRLDPPIVTERDEDAAVLELIAPEPREGVAAGARLLGANFEVLDTLDVTGFERTERRDGGGASFHRGDVDGDERAGFTDALAILGYLFRGAEPPSCLKAADADDDGIVRVSDAVRILLTVFRGEPELPAPADGCGPDPSADGLDCLESSCP